MDSLIVDWLILVLVTPLIIVAVVLLYGFLGCEPFEAAAPAKPDAPTNLLAKAAGPNLIKLTWDDKSGGAAKFKVIRIEEGATAPNVTGNRIGHGRKEAGCTEHVEQTVSAQAILHRSLHLGEIHCDAAFRQFGVGRRCAWVGSLAAQFPLVQLAAGEIMAFGSLHHFARTQDSRSGSTGERSGHYSASGPITLWTSLMLMTGGKSHWAMRSRSTCSLGARKTQ